MDEELKDTVKSLAESLQAMQVKILTLRSKVTRSDNSNLLASSQWSDLVSCIPPAVKRTTSEGDNVEPITEDEAEDGDDKNGEPETQQNLYKLSDEDGAFIEMAFVWKLDNATKKARATNLSLAGWEIQNWIRYCTTRNSTHRPCS